MKIRHGHVSNSSSSSFVIAYKELLKFDAEIIEKYPVLEYFNSLIKEAFKGEVINTFEEWNAHIIENFSYRNTDTVKAILEAEEFSCDIYNEVIEYIHQGYKIFLRTVDWYEDATTNELLPKMHDGENIIVIRGEW